MLLAATKPKKYACFGGVGAGLTDIYGGYAVWPLDIGTKTHGADCAAILDLLNKRAANGGHVAKVAGLPFSELSHMYCSYSTICYYAAQGFIYGNWAAPLLMFPAMLQATVGS